MKIFHAFTTVYRKHEAAISRHVAQFEDVRAEMAEKRQNIEKIEQLTAQIKQFQQQASEFEQLQLRGHQLNFDRVSFFTHLNFFFFAKAVSLLYQLSHIYPYIRPLFNVYLPKIQKYPKNWPKARKAQKSNSRRVFPKMRSKPSSRIVLNPKLSQSLNWTLNRLSDKV